MLDADLVVVGIGVEPATDFVEGVERDRDGGLPVDEQLALAPGVWAAGDVARYRDPYSGADVRIEHWRLAEQHGRAAARAMAGRGKPFAGVPFFWTQHFDLELGYAGAGRGWEEVVVVRRHRRRSTSRPSTRRASNCSPPAARSARSLAPSWSSCVSASCHQRASCAAAGRPVSTELLGE